MDFTKRTIFKIFAKKRAASKGRSPILPLLGAGGFSLHAFNRVQFDTFRSEAGSASYASPQHLFALWLISPHARSRTSRRTPSSRANSSYMYQNYVLVVNTRRSSALPNRRCPPAGDPVENLTVLLIIFSTTNFPQVRLHGFLATGLILLRREVDLVRSDLREIFLTSLHSSCYSGEACASIELCGRERSGTLVTVCFEGVDALTVGVRGCRSAVGGNEIVTVVVTILFFRSFQGAGDGFDTRRTYFHNCHFLPTMFHLRSA